MAVTIQVRRDTSANWVSANPVLHQGEPALETDTGKVKIGDGSTAWTSLAYEILPLAQLDARYTRVYSPMAFGAAGNGTTDDSTAVKAAFAAATSSGASGGTVDLGDYNFLTSSPVDLASNVMIRGSVPVAAPGVAAGQLGAIINNTGDIFQMPSGNVGHVVFENCGLVASAGHVFNAQGVSCSSWNMVNVFISQTSNSHAIWYQPNSTGVDSQAYSNMLVGDGCYFLSTGGTATIPAWQVITLNNINSNTWRRMTVSMGNSEAEPFFYLENIGTNGSELASDDVFEDITAEECQGGILEALSVDAMTLRNVQGWDAAYYKSVITIGTSATGLQPSNGITAINSGRRGGTLQSGAYDFQASSDTLNLVLINCIAQLGQDETTSLSVPQSTVIVPAQAYTPAAYENSAAGGTNGTTVTTGNSGSASGNAWTAVNGTVTFDNAETLAAGSSALAYKLVGSSSTAYLRWSVPNTVFPAPVQYLRVYFYLSATTFSCDLLTGPGLEFRVTYSSGGTLYADAGGSAVNGITTLSATTWYRLEAAISQATGTIVARLCNVNGVLLETITATGGTYTSNGSAYYGSQDSYTGTIWLAYPAWSNAGWIGP